MTNDEELEGMPERSAHIVYKATGTIKEGFSLPMPAVGDTQKFSINTIVKSITERKDKAGETEYVVTFDVT